MDKCKYCQAEIVWKDKKPNNPDGSWHKCPNYKRPKHVEPVHVACKQEIEALKDEIESLRKTICTPATTREDNHNRDLEQRIKRLEAIVVDIRKGLPVSPDY